MRRLLLLVVLISVATLAPGTATATHSPSGDEPARDFMSGSGQWCFGTECSSPLAFSVAAQAGPLGENPHGHIVNRSVGASARVTCLVVTGNRATAGGPFPDNPFGGLYVLGEDNPDPVPDRVFSAFIDIGVPPIPPTAGGCLAVHVFFSSLLFPLVRGNIIVHDGQPNALVTQTDLWP